jgi:hypothetical protein
MSTTPANPNIEAMRESAQQSYAELQQLIDGPLANLETYKLYETPIGNEWTIMQNLWHIVEFMPFWAGEVAKVVAEPGRIFGRTAEDEGRLRGISEHENDSLENVRTALPGSFARLNELLWTLKDDDLELMGKHVKYGERQVAWVIQEFETGHLQGHVEQIKGCLEMIR